MTVNRDPEAIIAAWLGEGPDLLPETTRRAIAVSTRTTHRSRPPLGLSWTGPNKNGVTRYAVAAVAIVAVVVGGLSFLRPGTGQPAGVGGPGSPAPSASASPSTSPPPPGSPAVSVEPLTQAFTSPTFGYSMKYPTDWTVTPTIGVGPDSGAADEFDSGAPGWYLRSLSRSIPEGAAVDDWIVGTLQVSSDSGCMPPRHIQESVIIDGHEGRIMGFCGRGPAPQVEATVVADKRAYLLTLFDNRPVPNESETRALFDRFAATITLDPASAVEVPAPSPSPSPS